jgi:hypothetical protein
MIENQNGIIVTEQKVLAKTGQTALIVAGMHRSGTSALTKVLNILGAGLPNNLMPPGEYNLRGFCESESIRQIHDQILASAGSYWDNTSGIPSAWFASPAAPEYEEKLLEILVQDMSELPLYVIKDPRICRVIPLWLKVFKRLGTEVRFILPLRHPLEIAASLKKRDGFDTNKSLLLWLGYFLDAERYTRGHIRCFVPYDNLLTSWRNVVGHLEKELEIVFPRQGHLATIEIEQFLCNGLRHHDLSREDLSGRSDIANWISQAFAWGMAASRGEKVYPEELDNIREAFQEADKIYGGIC